MATAPTNPEAGGRGGSGKGGTALRSWKGGPGRSQPVEKPIEPAADDLLSQIAGKEIEALLDEQAHGTDSAAGLTSTGMDAGTKGGTAAGDGAESAGGEDSLADVDVEAMLRDAASTLASEVEEAIARPGAEADGGAPAAGEAVATAEAAVAESATAPETKPTELTTRLDALFAELDTGKATVPAEESVAPEAGAVTDGLEAGKEVETPAQSGAATTEVAASAQVAAAGPVAEAAEVPAEPLMDAEMAMTVASVEDAAQREGTATPETAGPVGEVAGEVAAEAAGVTEDARDAVGEATEPGQAEVTAAGDAAPASPVTAEAGEAAAQMPEGAPAAGETHTDGAAAGETVTQALADVAAEVAAEVTDAGEKSAETQAAIREAVGAPVAAASGGGSEGAGAGAAVGGPVVVPVVAHGSAPAEAGGAKYVGPPFLAATKEWKPTKSAVKQLLERLPDTSGDRWQWLVRALAWVNRPFEFLSPEMRDMIGKVAILTLINSGVVMGYVWLLKR